MVPGMVERDFRAAEVGRHEEIATARRALAGGEPSRASIAMVLRFGSMAHRQAVLLLSRLRSARRPLFHPAKRLPG
ncbi:MAG: hypothetical protein H0V24_02900 [Chloroflexia bacterium]|nr:hypothetical protein [Chloroflexia bacterium]MDQ3413238.1 hypothetical protein [Chloroflexota bacterium]